MGALVPSGAAAQSARGGPVFAVALGSSLADVGAATLLVAAGEADAVLLVDAPDAAGAAATGLVRSHGAAGLVLVGGPAAVSAAVEAELSALAPRAAVSRIWGADREKTAAAVARRVLGSRSDARGAVVALANGWSPADAAAAAAAVAAGAVDAVLWTPADVLSDAAAGVLEEFSVRRVLVIGGPVAVSEQVADAAGAAAGAQVRRVGGATRTHTAVMVAQVATAGRINAAVLADGWDLHAAAQAAALAAASPDTVVLFAEPGGTLSELTAQFLFDSRPERVWALSADKATRDMLAQGVKRVAPQARVTRVDSPAAATQAAIDASRQQDDSPDGGSPGGGGGSPVAPPPPPVAPPAPAAPGAPGGVIVLSAPGDGTITIAWNAHAGAGTASLTGIEVDWAATGPDRGTDKAGLAKLAPDAVSETFENLTAGVTYEFTVVAVGPGGRAEARPVQHTLCEAPGAPTDPAAVVDGTTITLTWGPPAGRNCPVTSYVIERSRSDNTNRVDTTVDGNTHRLVIDNLPDATYSFGIATLNPLGRSVQRAFTSAVVSTSLDAPAAPSNVVAARGGDREVTVSWSAAASTTAAPVHGYEISWEETGGTNPLTHRVTGQATTTFTVPNLTPGQRYSFNVASYNTKDAVDKETYAATPASATPCGNGRPTDVTVTEAPGTGGATNGTLNISWTLPAVATGCSLSGITLDWAAFEIADGETENPANPDSETMWNSVTVSNTSATSASVTVSNADLTANDYTARVRVTRSTGAISAWNLPEHRATPLVDTFRWVDGTPNHNATIGRVFMMVAGADDDYLLSSGNASAVCRIPGGQPKVRQGQINCPPLTLVSLDVDSNNNTWDADARLTFTGQHVLMADHVDRTTSFEVGGPASPDHVVASGGDGALAIAWNKPSSVGRGDSSIVGYKVEYRRDVETDWTTVILADPAAREHTVTGLLNGATYHVTVRAFNNAGGNATCTAANGWPDAACHDGFNPTPLRVRLDAAHSGAPPAPSNPAVTAGNAKLTVTWDPSHAGGGTAGAVHAYSIRHRLQSDPDSAFVTRTLQSRRFSSDASRTQNTRTEIDGLTNNSAYVVQIRTHNANGTSAWTTIGTTHTPTS